MDVFMATKLPITLAESLRQIKWALGRALNCEEKRHNTLQQLLDCEKSGSNFLKRAQKNWEMQHKKCKSDRKALYFAGPQERWQAA